MMAIITFIFKICCFIVGLVALFCITFGLIDIMLWIFFGHSLEDIICTIIQHYKNDEIEITFETEQEYRDRKDYL